MNEKMQGDNYVSGIRAAYPKMVARVGEDEARKWLEHAIAARQCYVAGYVLSRVHTGGSLRLIRGA